MLTLAKQFDNLVEIKSNKSIVKGSIVCFYHSNDYLGKGLVVQRIQGIYSFLLDDLAKENYRTYRAKLFDYMILDEEIDEIEMLYDEY